MFGIDRISPIHQFRADAFLSFLKGSSFKSNSKNTLFKNVLTNSGQLLVANTIMMIFTLLQGLLLARAFGPERFGVLSLITAYTLTVTQFVDSRVWETATRYIIQYREISDFQRAGAIIKFCYLIDALTAMLAFMLLWITSGIAADLLIKYPDVAYLIQIYSFSVLLVIPVGTSSALLRIGRRFSFIACYNILVAALRFLGVTSVIYLDLGMREVFVVYLISSALGTSILLVFTWHVIKDLGVGQWWSVPFSVLQGRYGDIFRFLGITNGSAILKLVQQNADILLIGYFLTPASAGYYRFARSMVELIRLPLGPLYTVSYPEFTRLWYQDRVSDIRHLFKKLVVISVGVGAIGVTTLWLGGPTLIQLTVGSEFLASYPVMLWLAIGATVALAVSHGHPLLLAAGRARRSFTANLSSTFAQLIFIAGLVPLMGITGAGLAYLAHGLTWALVALPPAVALLRKSSAPTPERTISEPSTPSESNLI